MGRAGEVAGLLRFLLSFRREGTPGLRAGVLAVGVPRGLLLVRGQKMVLCRERWRVGGESAVPHPPVGALHAPERAASL